MSNSTNIKFNLDYYSPDKPRDNIFVLAYKNCDCKEIILSIDLDDLIIGQTYTINYSSVNNTASFSPSTQTIRAASNSQKFSTIMVIDPDKTHIVKAEIAGINITASQMCVIKCGSLSGCEINESSNIVLNQKNNWEYKIDQLPIFKFAPVSSLYNSVVLSVNSLSYITSKDAIMKSVSPLISTSTDIYISSTKIGSLVYLSNFNGQGVTITANNQNYQTTIKQGVLNIT